MSKILVEGGNVFKAPGWTKENPVMLTDRINRSEIAPTVEHIEALLSIDIADNLLGSTGIAESSGDIDVAIDANTTSKDEFVEHLLEAGVNPDHIVKTGDSVHYMSPIYSPDSEPTDRFVQVDFMFVPSVEFVKWSMRTAPESTYKGKYLQQLRADLTNTVAPKDASGKSLWKWNHFSGVLNRSDNSPVFGKFDPDAIAKGLLGLSATRHDLESVEGIMRLLKDNKRRREVIDTYRQTLARDQKGTQLPPDEELDRDYLEEDTATEREKLRQLRDEFKKKADEQNRKAKVVDNLEKMNQTQQVNELKVGDATKRLMKQQNQDKKQSSVGREFQHIEDLVYIEGIAGVNRALLRLAQIARNSKPLEVKWDGSPAIIFGRDENGTFHFGDKYAKQMLTNPREVYEYYTRTSKTEARQQFALEMAQLCPIYAAATPKNFRGFIEAGLMYKTTPPTNDQGEYYFTPNTVTYFVDSKSDLGQRIGNSISGAAATGTFNALPELGGQRSPVGDTYKQITGNQVVIIPPKFTDTTTNVDVEKLRTISKFAASVAQSLEAFIAPEQGLADIRNIIYTYINSQVDNHESLNNLGANFVDWIQNSGKVSVPKQEKIINRIKTNQRGANAVFKLVQAIMHIKDNIIHSKESETLGSLGIRAQMKTGEHGGEGFVHDPEGGVGPTKLVNRGTFTRANRLRESQEEQGPIAVVGWGRGMGHKGHMYLAQSVIEYADRIDGTPFFFVSETVGADDPLPPKVKLKIYQQVFPQQSNIFSTAHTIIPAIDAVHDQGFTRLVFIVGEDQKNSFKFLASQSKKTGNWNTKFGPNVTVMSRQETDTQSSNLEGPRATPMRDILRDPNATTKQKFAFWRDAMPDALSDRQVMTVMKMAAHNMGVSIE
jgi:hypothetical protein